MKESELIDALNGDNISSSQLHEYEHMALDKAIKYLENDFCQLVVIAFEETAELQQALTKVARGKGQRISVLEEYVDVLLGFKYLGMVYGINIDITKETDDADFNEMVICSQLSKNQQVIYNSLCGDRTALRSTCEKTIEMLGTVKQHFSFTNEEIRKIMYCKLKRLVNRIENNELI